VVKSPLDFRGFAGDLGGGTLAPRRLFRLGFGDSLLIGVGRGAAAALLAGFEALFEYVHQVDDVALAPESARRHAYGLLREALRESEKVGIAKVMTRSKEHLAALKSNGDPLVLEPMHFADEIVDQSTLEFLAQETPPESCKNRAQQHPIS
jgi:Ku70/Ku80 beta-barrel domain